MNRFAGLLAVAGATAFGVLAIFGAMAFRDSAEVPKWSPPSATYAPMMAGLAEMPSVAPRQVSAPIQPAPAVARQVAAAPPPPAPTPAAPPPQIVVETPPAPPSPPANVMPPVPVAPPVQQPPDLQDLDDDQVVQAQQEQQRKVMESNKMRMLDMRNAKRPFNRPRLNPNVQQQ